MTAATITVQAAKKSHAALERNESLMVMGLIRYLVPSAGSRRARAPQAGNLDRERTPLSLLCRGSGRRLIHVFLHVRLVVGLHLLEL